MRVAVVVLVLLALRLPAVRHALRNMQNMRACYRPAASPLMGLIGVVLCAFGVGLAIWARSHLGRNKIGIVACPMTRKENPELVISGPYAYVRHPIYTGMLIAALGTAISISPFWLIPLVLLGVYFVYSARREEKLMMEQFPGQYPQYMSRTKMLVPFVL